MALSDIVNASITLETARTVAPGFGIPLLLSHSAAWAERVRSYSSLAAVGADFAVTTPEYLMARAIFSQDIVPPIIKIGRCALVPTQRWAITPVAFNSTIYKLTVVGTNGVENVVSITSDASATVAEIIGALKTAIDALGLAITTSDQTTFLRIVANVAGAFFAVYVDDVSKLGIAQDHADPGLATDLAAIQLEDPAWYCPVDPFPSALVVAAIAAWAEANTKLYIQDSQDSKIVTDVLSGATDIAATLKTSAYARSSVWYHRKFHEFLASALLGRVLPIDPGAEVWAFKTLRTISTDILTPTQRTNALNKFANVYEDVAGIGITEMGKVAANEWIDVIRGRDWQISDMSTRVFTDLAAADKIPYTNKGIAIIKGDMRASLKLGVERGFLSDDPEDEPQVLGPKASEVSPADRAARKYTATFSARLAGAIQLVTITGTLSV